MIRPYLNLWERVSQVWFNQWTLVLALMCIKLFIFKLSLVSSIDQISLASAAACTSVNEFGLSIAQYPNESVRQANNFVSRSIDMLELQHIQSLRLLISVVECLIVFWVEVLFGTYTCLVTALMNGTVDLAFDATDALISLVNLTLVAATTEIQKELKGIETIVKKLLSTIDKVKDFFNGGSHDDASREHVHRINLTLSVLEDIRIPASVTDKIESVRSKVPTFSTNSTISYIEGGFQDIKSRIAAKPANTTVQPLPAPNFAPLQVCSPKTSEELNQAYQMAAKRICRISQRMMIALIILAIAVIVPMVVLECLKWKRQTEMMIEMRNTLALVPETAESLTKKTSCAIYSTINKFDHKIVYYLIRIFHAGPSCQWILSYVFSLRSVTLMFIGAAALITVGLQFLLMGVLISAMQGAATSDQVQDFQHQYRAALAEVAKNWTGETNSYITREEKAINNQLFGWVQSTTDHINGTIVVIVNDIGKGISFFKHTVFYKPVKSVIYCVIGRKLESIQHGLDWIHEHAVINLPRVSEDRIFQPLRNQNSSSQNISMSSMTNLISNTADKIIASYKDALRIELYIAIAIISLWGFEVVMGLAYSVLQRYRHRIDSARPPLCEKTLELQANQIGTPQPLTDTQKQLYGYPFVSPYEKFDRLGACQGGASSSRYSGSDAQTLSPLNGITH
jgi:hypothetical protein